jgi:hypothetical protein
MKPRPADPAPDFCDAISHVKIVPDGRFIEVVIVISNCFPSPHSTEVPDSGE